MHDENRRLCYQASGGVYDWYANGGKLSLLKEINRICFLSGQCEKEILLLWHF